MTHICVNRTLLYSQIYVCVRAYHYCNHYCKCLLYVPAVRLQCRSLVDFNLSFVSSYGLFL